MKDYELKKSSSYYHLSDDQRIKFNVSRFNIFIPLLP